MGGQRATSRRGEGKGRLEIGNEGTVEKLMRGAIDFHVHPAPDPYHERRLDALELAREAKGAGMRAVVAKNHQFGTAILAQAVNKLVPGFTVIGSLTLNREVGGLCPDVVRAAAKAGARVVWMPTMSSVINSRGEPGIPLFDGEGHLLPEVLQILAIVGDNGMVVGTGHVSRDEIYALASAAKDMAVKITITHPLTRGFGYQCSLDEQRELASMGAVIEHCFVACMPVLGSLDPSVIVEHIRAVGVDRCILSTDFGQLANPSPVEGFRMMIAAMLECGLSEDEIERLVRTNVERLLRPFEAKSEAEVEANHD